MTDNLGKMVYLGTLQLSSGKLGRNILVCLCLSLLFISANSSRTHPAEVSALRSIKGSLIDPYNNLRNWNRGDPCTSNWTGSICHNSTLSDNYFHIKELLLLNNNLSGSLSPELGRLSYLEILDFMWNNISGTIPKEIGNITTLELLLLNGNKLTGFLPDELGYLSNLDRIQIDENQISGPIPLSFANLSKAKHFHMNNNSLSGQIPPELSRLPVLVHLLLDNNNFSGDLPPQFSELPHLLILSLRNCSLRGSIPDWSNMSNIAYIDLSLNQLSGSIPTGALSENITTMSLANNLLVGPVPSIIWQNRTLNASERLILDFENNKFSNISGSLSVPPNVTIGFVIYTASNFCSLFFPTLVMFLIVEELLMCFLHLYSKLFQTSGKSSMLNENASQFCAPHEEDFSNTVNITRLNDCPQSCPPPYEYAPASPAIRCFCAAPLYIGYRLKSPSFSYFLPYFNTFDRNLSSGLGLNLYQLQIDSAAWQKGPRLRMYLKIFPTYANKSEQLLNRSEVERILSLFEFHPSPSSINKGALAGIIIGTIAGSVTLSAFVSLLILRRRIQKHQSSKRHLLSRISIKIDGVKDFTYAEMALATNNFSSSSLVGQGGYGKVYKGTLADGTIVAIKRAQEGSLQGEKEFLTEIELLSRLHHRNLVSLIGYCDEEGEQMLIYEFMSNGTLRDHLSGKFKAPMSFSMRLRTALGAARGILYLHTEANPPIFHRDIKATNILLDSKYTAKVADFGLSRLAPVPELEGAVPAHVSTVVKGTPGYLDPEYFLTHKLTDKSDVYSLGVVLMELLTGMHPISHGKNIVREVKTAYRSGMIFSVIDERMGSYPSECVEKFVILALKCCQDETDERPSMAVVVRELENIWSMMPESDSKITESVVSKPGMVPTPPSSISSSSSTLRTPYVSQDVSGSDLVSGAIRSVAPR
ncbi:UNVERIFIED_CONTAM: putative LRR receptor-like serine/threonine-protein kinase [Sesamum angustifolium]|uniref:non-specific serine/threonine protein kinase n=1 Tax=Sesamum angustifolium TaxID=2727405 RepID=A0AAW2QT36_9LAMI